MTTKRFKYRDAGLEPDRTDGRVRREGAKISSEAGKDTDEKSCMYI